MNTALIVTGIGDDTHHLERATQSWPDRYGIEPIMHVFGWEGAVEEYDSRLEALRNHAWEVGARALIGVSAGASASAVVASETPGLGYVNVCGRLHEEGNNIYKFDKYRTRAPMFVESVGRAEAALHLLDPETSLIYWARFDEMVPQQAALVRGIATKIAPLPSHRLGIYSVLRFRGKEISHVINRSISRA